MRALFRSCLAGMASLLLLPLSYADNHSDANVADMWVVVPHPGESQAFEKAFKKHLAFRIEQNDPRQWQVYQPIVGDNLTHYVIRACCFSWKQLDEYRDWSKNAKTGDHWQKHTKGLVAHVSHYLAEVDFENSHWPKEDNDYRYFEVVSMTPRSGHGGAIQADMKAISDAAKAMNWPQHWSWSWGIGGKPTLDLVFAHKDWADMAPDKPSFAERLAGQMGSGDEAKALLERWGGHFKGSNVSIYARSDELSMPAKSE